MGTPARPKSIYIYIYIYIYISYRLHEYIDPQGLRADVWLQDVKEVGQ